MNAPGLVALVIEWACWGFIGFCFGTVFGAGMMARQNRNEGPTKTE